MDLRGAKLMTVAGAGIALVAAIVGASQRASCGQGVVWSTGLIGALERMNNDLREQACLQDSLESPTTFFLVAGLIMLAVGVTLWIRKANVSLPSQTKCPKCAEKIRIEAIVCKHCGAELSANSGE